MSALYTCRLNFCLFYIFRSRKAGTVSTVNDTGVVVDTGEQFHGGVIDTDDKFRLFGYF